MKHGSLAVEYWTLIRGRLDLNALWSRLGAWSFLFSLRCPSLLSCVNDYLAIKTVVDICEWLVFVQYVWLNASQRCWGCWNEHVCQEEAKWNYGGSTRSFYDQTNQSGTCLNKTHFPPGQIWSNFRGNFLKEFWVVGISIHVEKWSKFPYIYDMFQKWIHLYTENAFIYVMLALFRKSKTSNNAFSPCIFF